MYSVVSDSLWPHRLWFIGSSVHGIAQARILEWVAIFSSKGSSQSRDRNCVPCVFCIVGRFFTTEPPRNLNRGLLTILKGGNVFHSLLGHPQRQNPILKRLLCFICHAFTSHPNQKEKKTRKRGFTCTVIICFGLPKNSFTAILRTDTPNLSIPKMST